MKAKKIKIDEPTFYSFMMKENSFPSWFDLWKDGVIKIPLELGTWKDQKYSSFMSDNDLDVFLGTHERESLYSFNMNEKYVGKDKNYYFFLMEVHVRRFSNIFNEFSIAILIKLVPKRKTAKSYGCKEAFTCFTYEIMCPVLQGI